MRLTRRGTEWRDGALGARWPAKGGILCFFNTRGPERQTLRLHQEGIVGKIGSGGGKRARPAVCSLPECPWKVTGTFWGSAFISPKWDPQALNDSTLPWASAPPWVG